MMFRQRYGRETENMTDRAFGGAKIALLCDGRLLVYQRDDKPGIPWPRMWDLPGGGRENGETPLQCVLRETQEEFGVLLAERRVVWQRRYDGIQPGYPPTLVYGRGDHPGADRRHSLWR